jgi:hypothetical protein
LESGQKQPQQLTCSSNQSLAQSAFQIGRRVADKLTAEKDSQDALKRRSAGQEIIVLN